MKKLYVFLVGLLCGATFAQAQCTISLTANPNSPVCAGTAVHLTASGANTYVWTPGGMTSNSVTVYPTGTTTYLVTGTDLSSNTCSAFVVVTVLPHDNASFNYTPSTLCGSGPDALPNITGGATGTFISSPMGLIFLDSIVGLIDVSASAINVYTITFTTNGVCPAQSTATVTIIGSPTAAFSYAGPYCPGGINPLPTFGTGASAGIFSTSEGLFFLSTATGQVDVSVSIPGVYTVINTIAASGGCAAVSDSNYITINPTPTVVVPENITSCIGNTILASNYISMPLGGTFTWTNSNTSIGLGVTGTGEVPSFVATNSTGSPIVATITVTPTVYGCLGMPNSYTITVSPNFSSNVTPPNANVNAGQCATFHITTAGTYTWTPATGLNTSVGATVTACPATTTTYTVYGSNGSGCTFTTLVTVHVTGNYIDDVSGSSPCHLPYLAILNIADEFVQHNDTILYNLNYGDGIDTTFTMIYQNNPTPIAAITHAYTAVGTYSPSVILQHTNGLADTIYTQTLILASDTCGDISGTVFYDMNANCLPDAGEFRISYALIKLFNSGHTLLQAQFTDVNGFYNFTVPNGNYTVEIDSLIYSSFGLSCPTGGTYTISGIPTTSKNYGVNCTAGFDLYGTMAAGLFRHEFNANLWFNIGNLLCTSTNATAKLVLDHRTTYAYATPTPSNMSGDTIWWNVNHLSIADTAYKTIYLNVYVSPTAVINDSLQFKLTVSPISGDVNPLNNTVIKKFRVIGSWDPNFKEVSPSGDITKNTDLTYTIHFQNTGNAEAYNVYILDTLDAHLNLSTLEIVAASHPYSVEILNSTQKDVLKFFFPNIMLPDSSSNQMLSNGFVSYKIRPLANCVEGTIITNLADIYFDYNPAVPTNMVQNQIPLILGVNEETNNSTRDRVIPNPVSQQATLTYAVPEQGKTLIKLFDITGKETLTLLNQDLTQGEHHLTFDCKDLKSGIYFIRICTSRSSSVVKLVKL